MKKTSSILAILASAVCLLVLTQSCKQPSMQPMDYSQEANWMFQSPVTHEVDLFYIYPTCVNPQCTTLVCPVDDHMKEKAHYTYQQNAECFSSYTNVFAPYYRQIGVAGIASCKEYTDLIELDRQNEPWCDLNAALDYYFTKLNTDRPVIFASHSQGSACMHIVMDTYMKQHPELKERIVAVYALGMCASQEFCDEIGIPFATGEEDAGCYISWNTEGPGATKPNFPVGNTLVINPLTWTRDTTYAGIELNLGSLQQNEAGELVEVPARADAQIDAERRVVVCTTNPAMIPDNPLFGDKSMHFEDGALFYANMKENGKKRITTFLGHEPR